MANVKNHLIYLLVTLLPVCGCGFALHWLNLIISVPNFTVFLRVTYAVFASFRGITLQNARLFLQAQAW